MAITLPKDRRYLIGFRFNELIPFELNTLSLDTLLPPLFRKAILRGYEAKRSSDDEIANIDASIDKLVSHERLTGFDGAANERMMRRLAQSLLFVPIRNQKTKQLQINGLIPYTLAPFAVGFPTNLAGFRQVDQFLYQMLLNESKHERDEVRKLIEDTFGEGIEAGDIKEPTACRVIGPEPNLDVIAELSIAYVEGFRPITVGKESLHGYIPATPLPHFQANFGRHLHRYLISYAQRVPRALLIDQVETVIAFELSIMTSKLFEHVPAWEADADANFGGLIETGEPEIYLDFVGDQRHLSWSIASRCVRRDLESLPGFVESILHLRYLHAAVRQLGRGGPTKALIESEIAGIEKDDTTSYIAALLRLRESPAFAPYLLIQAGSDLTAIQEANKLGSKADRDDIDDEVKSDADRLADELSERGLDQLEQIQYFLVQSQQRTASGNVLGWIRDIGRVEAGDGLISGGSNRNTWAYAPSNGLLTVLVQLCAIDSKRWNPKKGKIGPEPFSVQEFLDWLVDQFGIVVDRPPAGLGFDGPEYATAARENLQAMLRRLRQMGMFEDQSDDVSVQQIVPPFIDGDAAVTRSIADVGSGR